MKKIYSFAIAMLMAGVFSVSAMAQTTQKFVKVEAEPTSWDGTYLIVYELDGDLANVFNGSLEELDAKGNFYTNVSDAKQTVNGSSVRVIEATDEMLAATFTVTKSETEGKYNVKSHSGYWIGYNSTDPGEDGVNPDPNMKTSNEKAYDNDIQMQEGKTNVIVTAKNGFELRFNDSTGKERFRYHASGKKEPVKFYSLEQVDESGNVVTGIAHANANQSENVIYNIAGQRMSQMQKGLNIVNGKKVIK